MRKNHSFKTKIVGILNVTPDSFFDGGKYLEERNCLKQLEKLIADGADFIDVGAQSTRPLAEIICVDEEWQRLEKILPKIIKIAHQNNIGVSLDSFNFQNIQKAVDLGIDMINDVSGGQSKQMALVAAKNPQLKFVFMHNLGVPPRKQIVIDPKLDVVEQIIIWAKNRVDELEQLGVKKDNLIFDCGIGFGKNPEQNIEIINRIDEFRILDLPIYVGHSNKSFLDFYDNSNLTREEKTAKINEVLIDKNVDYLRLHEVIFVNAAQI